MKFPIQLFRIEGRSMEPTLYEGDRVLLSTLLKGRVGDLIVFKKNARTMVKRIAKIEGHQYTVQGDNPSKSTASEHFGRIHRSQIIGRVLWTFRST